MHEEAGVGKGGDYGYLSYIVVILCLDGGVSAQTRSQEPQQQSWPQRRRRRHHGGCHFGFERKPHYESKDMAETGDTWNMMPQTKRYVVIKPLQVKSRVCYGLIFLVQV